MAVLYNMDPFLVLRIIYGGRTDGIAEEDFERNKKERGIDVPQIVQVFLNKYAYLSVNRQGSCVRFLHPNIMSRWHFTADDGTVLPLVAVGREGDYQILVREGNVRDPAVFLLKPSEGASLISLSNYTITELLREMLFSVLIKSKNAVISDDPEQAVAMLRKSGADYPEVEKAAYQSRKYTFNFSDEMRMFVISELGDEGELSRFVFVQDENFLRN